MIFLNINIVVGILLLVLHTLCSIDTAFEFKRLYPGMKTPKTNWAGKILSIIKAIIIALIPIYNIALCLVYLFKYDELKTKVIDAVYAKCMKEKQNVTHLSETSEG